MEVPITQETVPTGEEKIIQNSLVGRVDGYDVHMHNSGAAAIIADGSIEVHSGGGMALVAGHDLNVNEGGGQFMIAGNSMQVSQGGGGIVIAGNSVNMTQGGGGLILSPQVRVEEGRVGILISRTPTIQGEVGVVINTPQAVAIGAAFGGFFALLSWLLRRK
jgi:hypothetical protein